MKKKTPLEINEFSRFLKIFGEESDRGAALAAATYLDERLKGILESFLSDTKATQELLGGFNAPLGTFSARIKAAYSLGLIQDNEFEELETIRKIRNEFAHSWDGVSFDTQKVADLCRLLPWLGPTEFEADSGPRERFNNAVAILLADFLWRSKLVGKERRRLKKWPHKVRQ
jgi:mannitol operon repressor